MYGIGFLFGFSDEFIIVIISKSFGRSYYTKSYNWNGLLNEILEN